jgi:hypothetical protein
MQRPKRWWTIGLVAWAVIALAALTLVLVINQYQHSADYPGALFVGDHTIYQFNPSPVIRRDASYRSSDPFNKVFNWYSSEFKLGPETFAQSGCALMARSFTDFKIVEREMSVMVCDTPNGRLIFVMRSLSLRWR